MELRIHLQIYLEHVVLFSIVPYEYKISETMEFKFSEIICYTYIFKTRLARSINTIFPFLNKKQYIIILSVCLIKKLVFFPHRSIKKNRKRFIVNSAYSLEINVSACKNPSSRIQLPTQAKPT